MDAFLFLDVSALVLVGVSASGLLSPCSFLLFIFWVALWASCLFPFICLPAWLRCLWLCFRFCAFATFRLADLVAAFAPFGLCLPFVSVGVQAFTHLCLVCHFGSPCFEFVSESGCWCPSLIDICPQCPPIVLGRRPTGPFAFACLLWAGSEDFGSHPFVPPTCILVVACGWAGMGDFGSYCMSLSS